MVDDLFCNGPDPAPIIRAGSPVKVSNGAFRAPTRFAPNVVGLSTPMPAVVSEMNCEITVHNAPENGVGDGSCTDPRRIHP